MSKEQQINQNTYLKHQNQQAYLLYCQQIIYYLHALNWLKAMYICEISTVYSEKCTSGAEILSTELHQEIADVKPLKHKEKSNSKTGLASGSPYYQKDDDTGLYYANARYYDSDTGRFLREDPFNGDVNTPPSLHRYLYANANPTYYIDPTGNVSVINKLKEFYDKPVEMMAAKIDNESTSDSEVFALTVASFSNEAVSGGLSLVNTIVNAMIVEADDNSKRLNSSFNFQNVLGFDTSSVRREHEEFVKGAKQVGNKIVDEHVGLIDKALKSGFRTYFDAIGGKNKAQSNITKGLGGFITGSWFARMKGAPKVERVIEGGDNNLELERMPLRDSNGRLRNSDGTFARDNSTLKTELQRSSLRADTKRRIESNAPANAQGQFIDKNGIVIENYHYGHISGHENRRILAAGSELNLTQKQLNDYVNARPQFFKIEDVKRNLSHIDELPGIDNIDDLIIDMENFFDK